MQKLSVVPEIVASRKITFLDEREIPISICEKSQSNYVSQFEKPYLVIDTFKKKTIKQEVLVYIEVEELKKLDYHLARVNVPVNRGWFRGQKVIYLLENSMSHRVDSRKLTYIPTEHKIQKDIANKRIRIVGRCAGYPHFENKGGGCGPWCPIK